MAIPHNRFKPEAVKLRKRGASYNEIRKHLPVAKSTLSLWLRDVPLKLKYRERFYTKQIEILSRGPKSQKERRAAEVNKIINNATSEIKVPLDQQAMLLTGVALYWAEGSKSKRFQMTNSDPYMILFVVRWIEQIFHIKPDKLKASLNIYKQQNDQKLKRFWSDLTKIPVVNFRKSYIKPEGKGYKKNNLYYGTIRIEIPKSTDINYRIVGWTKGMLRNIVKETERIEKRWKILRQTPRPVNL